MIRFTASATVGLGYLPQSLNATAHAHWRALGDALVNGGWLPDDTPEHFRFGALVFEVVSGVRATRVHICWADVAQPVSGRSHGAGEVS